MPALTLPSAPSREPEGKEGLTSASEITASPQRKRPSNPGSNKHKKVRGLPCDLIPVPGAPPSATERPTCFLYCLPSSPLPRASELRVSSLNAQDVARFVDEDDFGDASDSPVEAPVTPQRSPDQDNDDRPSSSGSAFRNLLEICQERPRAVRAAAQDWCARYKSHRLSAAAQLLTLFVQAAGADAAVSTVQASKDAGEPLAQEIRAIVAQAAKQGGHTPFAKRKGASTEQAYLTFVDEAVSALHPHGLLLDDFLMPRAIDALAEVSKSAVTQFRRCATTTACRITCVLCAVLTTVSETLDTAQRQLAAEERKKGKSRSEERVAALQEQMEAAVQDKDAIGELMDQLHASVSGTRFRDVDDGIRTAVVDAIGEWSVLLPARFLNDGYLKYIAWALSDRAASVRCAALQALLGVFAAEENRSAMHEFVARFKQRFLEMMDDVDDGVVALALDLLARLVELGELGPEEVTQAHRHLADASADVRRAAGALVSRSLEDMGRAAGAPARDKKGRRAAALDATADQLQLEGLLVLLEKMSSAGGGVAATADPGPVVKGAVTALSAHVPALTDWKLLAEALGNESRSEEGTALLCHVVRHAAEAATAPLAEAAPRGAFKSKASRDQALKHREKLTAAFLTALPKLLVQFKSDPSLAGALVPVASQLQLSQYALRKEERAFQSLLDSVSGALTRITDGPGLAGCAHALAHLCAAEAAPLREAATVQWEATGRKVAAELVAAARAAKRNRAEDDEGTDEDAGADAWRLADPSARPADAHLFALSVALDRLLSLQCEAAAGRLQWAVPGECAGAVEVVFDLLGDGIDVGPVVTRSASILLLHDVDAKVREVLSTPAEHASAPGKVAAAGEALGAAARGLRDVLESGVRPVTKQQALCCLADVVAVRASLAAHPSAASLYAPLDADTAGALWGAAGGALAEYSEPPGDLDDDADDSERRDHEQATARHEAVESVQLRVLTALCKVALHSALAGAEGGEWPAPLVDLVARVASHWTSHGEAIADLVKHTLARLRKVCPGSGASLPRALAAALRHAFQPALSGDDAALGRLAGLADAVGRMFSGFSASAASVQVLVERGITAAFPLGARAQLPGAHNEPRWHAFLERAVTPFVCKMAPADAEAAAVLLEERAAVFGPEEEEKEWDPYFALLTALSDRARGGGRKRGGAAAAARDEGAGAQGEAQGEPPGSRAKRARSLAAHPVEDDIEMSDASEGAASLGGARPTGLEASSDDEGAGPRVLTEEELPGWVPDPQSQLSDDTMAARPRPRRRRD